MSSQHVRPLLSAYVDGEATPAERRQVDDHLVGCAECAAVLAEYRSIGSNVRALPRPVPPPTLHRDVWTAIEANRGRAAWGAHLAGLLRWGAVGATALAAIVIALVLWPKAPPAAGVQMTRPVNGQTNVGVNSPVILHFQPPVTEFAKEQVRVSRNVNADTVYARWIVTGTDLEMGLNYPPGAGRDVPVPHWPALSVITITVQGPVYTEDGQSVLIKGGEYKQFTFTTGTQLDPTDTPSPVPTDTATPMPPTETPIVPTPELPPTETAVVPPETPVPPTREPPVVGTETAVPPPPTRQPTVPPPPTVTTAPVEPTRPPSPVPPSVTPLPPVPTPPSVTPIPPSATPVPPTNTPVPPTSTPEPTGVAVPTPTFVLPPPQGTPGGQPTPPPVSTSTPDNGAARGTPTLEPMSGTPRVPSPTPATTPSAVAGCPNPPQRGFGQVYNSPSHAALRQTLGCPSAPEAGFASAAEQNFEHGYMFWNGDTKRIYVFSATTNTWRSYADAWTEGTPPATLLTPPAGTYQPVRGFGKIWLDYPEVRQALGWATGQERSIQAAWQAFAHGAMLWTDSRLIRVLYDTGGWELYYDTYAGP